MLLFGCHRDFPSVREHVLRPLRREARPDQPPSAAGGFRRPTCFFFIFGRDAARLVNAAGRVYDADLADIARRQEEIWEGVRAILTRPASIF